MRFAKCFCAQLNFCEQVAKVRLQIAGVQAAAPGSIVYKGLFGTLFGMAKHEGLSSLYGGISPGLQRQCVFASIRIGLYEPVKEFYSDLFQTGNSNSSLMTVRIASAITTGTIGITAAQVDILPH